MAVRYDEAYRCVGPPEGQVGLRLLREWAMGRWQRQIQDLGIYNCRPVRGGTTPSVHSNGRAWDCRWATLAAKEAYLAVVTGEADKLNVQRVIDYSRQRIWTTGSGWQPHQVLSPGGYATHTERNWDGALDARPIASIIGYVPQAEDDEPEDDDVFLPVRKPVAKAGPSQMSSGRIPGYLTSGTKILGIHGAALAGDRALDGTDAVSPAPKTEIRVLQTKSAHKLTSLFYWIDEDGKEDLGKIGAVAADFGTFGPYQCT